VRASERAAVRSGRSPGVVLIGEKGGEGRGGGRDASHLGRLFALSGGGGGRLLVTWWM
jgi:hypothetical protein